MRAYLMTFLPLIRGPCVNLRLVSLKSEKNCFGFCVSYPNFYYISLDTIHDIAAVVSDFNQRYGDYLGQNNVNMLANL